MNPIAIWSKFKNYLDWCYQHRIPDETEFVEGFEYEYISLLGTYPKKENIKPYLSIDYDIIPHNWEKRVVTNRLMDYEVIWSIIPVTYGSTKTKLPINHLRAYLEAGYIRVLKDTTIIDEEYKDDEWVKDGIYETRYRIYKCLDKAKHKVKCIGFYNSIHKLCIYHKRILSSNCKEISDMKEEENKDNQSIIKSKYKLNLNLIRPNLQIISNLYEEIGNRRKRIINWFYSKQRNKYIRQIGYNIDGIFHPGKSFGKSLKILKKIVPKHITIIDTINKYPSRCLEINKGYIPLHTIEEIKNNLYNDQPEKNPQFISFKNHKLERLVYIATKDRKQYARVHWYEANEKIITQLADEPEWEYISKKEGKKHFNTISPGQSLIPASEPWIEKIKDYETGEEYEEYVGTFKNIYKPTIKVPKGKSSTKRVDHSNTIKSKRNHPGRNNRLKSVLWNVTLTKNNDTSIGPVKECTFKVEAINEQAAINKAWNKFVPLYDVKLTQIKPYYNAVAKRSEESNTNVLLKEDHSTKSLFEPIKYVLINTLKNGDKKISEVTSYKRIYSKPDISPFKKKWKCPMTNPSKKFSTIKIEEERKKFNEELKLKKQNKVIERKTNNKKTLV